MGVSAGFFLIMYGQVAVKTNVAIDAVAIPNLGVEVGLSKKLTVDIPFIIIPGNTAIINVETGDGTARVALLAL